MEIVEDIQQKQANSEPEKMVEQEVELTPEEKEAKQRKEWNVLLRSGTPRNKQRQRLYARQQRAKRNKNRDQE
jgi:hypothetical protein